MSRYSPQVLPQGTDYTQFTNALFGGLEQAELMRRRRQADAERAEDREYTRTQRKQAEEDRQREIARQKQADALRDMELYDTHGARTLDQIRAEGGMVSAAKPGRSVAEEFDRITAPAEDGGSFMLPGGRVEVATGRPTPVVRGLDGAEVKRPDARYQRFGDLYRDPEATAQAREQRRAANADAVSRELVALLNPEIAAHLPEGSDYSELVKPSFETYGRKSVAGVQHGHSLGEIAARGEEERRTKRTAAAEGPATGWCRCTRAPARAARSPGPTASR